MGNIRLFVSHAHKDQEIAVALVKVIETAMEPPPDRKEESILCSLHPKYGEPEGVNVIEYLREHLKQSTCVLAVLTPNSMKSPWCMFELGGAWTLATPTYCLLAGELSQEKMPAALKGTDAVQLTAPKEIREMLPKLCKALGWKKRLNVSAEKEIDDLVNLVRRCSWNSP